MNNLNPCSLSQEKVESLITSILHSYNLLNTELSVEEKDKYSGGFFSSKTRTLKESEISLKAILSLSFKVAFTSNLFIPEEFEEIMTQNTFSGIPKEDEIYNLVVSHNNKLSEVKRWFSNLVEEKQADSSGSKLIPLLNSISKTSKEGKLNSLIKLLGKVELLSEVSISNSVKIGKLILTAQAMIYLAKSNLKVLPGKFPSSQKVINLLSVELERIKVRPVWFYDGEGRPFQNYFKGKTLPVNCIYTGALDLEVIAKELIRLQEQQS